MYARLKFSPALKFPTAAQCMLSVSEIGVYGVPKTAAPIAPSAFACSIDELISVVRLSVPVARTSGKNTFHALSDARLAISKSISALLSVRLWARA